MDSIKQFLTHLITGIDNKTADAGRLLWIAGVLAFIGYAGYQVYANKTWDATSYGTGLGLALAGGGAGIGLKAKTEPPVGSDKDQDGSN